MGRRGAWATAVPLFLSMLAFLPVPSTASEAAAWSDLTPITVTQDHVQAWEFDMDDEGNWVWAWASQGTCGPKVEAITGGAEGNGTTPVLLAGSECGTAPSGNASGRLISVSAVNGRAAALFITETATESLGLTIFDGDNGWQDVRTIGRRGTGTIFNAFVLLDGEGNATALWNEGDYFGDGVFDIYARRVALDGTMGELVVVDNSTKKAELSGNPAISENGTILLAWSLGQGADMQIMGGRISPTGEIAQTSFPEDATDASGWAVWHAGASTGYQALLHWLRGAGGESAWLRTCDPDGTWSDPIVVSPTTSSSPQWADIAIADDGNVTLLWKERAGEGVEVSAETWGAGNESSTKSAVGSETADTPMWVGVEVSTETWGVAVWTVENNSRYSMGAALMVGAGSWGGVAHWTIGGPMKELQGVGRAAGAGGFAAAAFVQLDYSDNDAWVWTLLLARFGGEAPKPPLLELLAPPRPPTTTEASFEVVGTTDPGSAVSVQGVAVAVQLNGSFAATVPLEVGNNTIEVVATSGAGVSVVHRIIVQRVASNPPAPLPEDPIRVSTFDPMVLWFGVALAFAGVGAFLWLHAMRRSAR